MILQRPPAPGFLKGRPLDLIGLEPGVRKRACSNKHVEREDDYRYAFSQLVIFPGDH